MKSPLKSLKRLFKRKPKWRFEEGVDFHIVPDIEACKKNDPHPWSIHFLGRIIKVHSLKIPDSPDESGQLHVDIKAEVLYGDDLNKEESQMFGDLLMELTHRSLLIRD